MLADPILTNGHSDVEDIEDLNFGDTVAGRDEVRQKVVPKIIKKPTVKKNNSKVSTPNENFHGDSFVPGHQKIYVKTWGCSHNNSDSEYMAGQLAQAGYSIVSNEDEADLCLLNSCTVKNPAEEHFKNSINKSLSAGRKVVVAGCVSQAEPRAEFLSGLSIVGTHQTDRVVEVVEETLKGNSVRLLATKSVKGKKLGGASLNLPKIRRNPLIEILAINTGCLNHCTYCKTKEARGNLGSYSIEEIVQRCVQSFEEGVKEIWMTSEDTGAYGRDLGLTLPDLLNEVVKVIPEGCKLRLGMTNPPYIMDYLEDMATILSHPRVYSFLHIPVQSGSDPVLKEMRREYTRDQFCQVIEFLRKSVPGITIATDIICGFPTETEEDFEDTMSLCQKYRFPSLYINQFYPRPGTPAAKMKRIPTDIVKNRTRKLTAFFDTVLPYEGRVGRIYEILVTEVAADKKHYVGHNKFYEQILIPAEPEFMGQNLRVRIIETGKYFMKGKVLKPPAITPRMATAFFIFCSLVVVLLALFFPRYHFI